MECPKCHGALIEKTLQGYPLRGCLRCGGMWIDKDILSNLARTLSWEIPKTDDKKKLLFQRNPVTRPQSGSSAVCPHCGTGLEEFNFAYDSNIMLDRCPNCYGMWLDPGELLKIARHMQYDPDLDAVGRSILQSAGSSDDTEPGFSDVINWPYSLHQPPMLLVYLLLRIGYIVSRMIFKG